MSFFGSIKRALGFSDSEAEDDEYYGSQPDGDSSQPAVNVSPEPATDSGSVADGDAAANVTVRIFDSVVAMFNQALPSFLAQSVNPEAQKQLLYQALEADVKAYLAQLNTQAEQRVQHDFQERQSALQSEITEAQKTAKTLEEKRNKLKQQQLSAERQKRALSERVHDLESQLATMQAENEQYKLENQALVNKVRVAGVTGGDNETAAKKIAELEQNLSEQQAQNQLSTTMINDLQKLASDARQQAETANSQCVEAQERANKLQQDLDYANQQLKIAEQIQDEIVKFEEIKNRLDKKISDLKKKNKELKAQVKELEEHFNINPETEEINSVDFLMLEHDDEPIVPEQPEPSTAAEPPAEYKTEQPQQPNNKPSADPNDYQLSLW